MVVGYVSPKIAPETAECGVERFQETWMSCEVKPQTAKLAAAIDFFLSNSRCSGSQMPEQRLRSSYSGKARRLYVVLFPDLDSSTNPDSSTDSVAWSNPISAFPEQRTRLFEDLAILAKDPPGVNVLYKSSRYYQRPGKFATRGEDCAGGENGLVKVSITSRQECAGLAYYMYLCCKNTLRLLSKFYVVHKHTTRTNLSAYYGSNGRTRRPHRYSGVISKQWRNLAQGVHVSASR